MESNIKTFSIYTKFTTKIPSFIKTTDKIHKALYDEMRNLSDTLGMLMVGNILTKNKLAKINTCAEISMNNIEEILEICNEPIGLLLNQYYDELFEDILDVAIENEEFEIAENIKNYINTYGL